MNEKIEFELTLPDARDSDLTALLQDLQQSMNVELASDSDFSMELRKSDQTTQDLGTILAVILGAKATIALAAGISAWMKRKNQARIRIKTASGEEVYITNLESRHIAEVLANLK